MSASALRPRRGARDGKPGERSRCPRGTRCCRPRRPGRDIIVLTTELARLYRDAGEAQEIIDWPTA